MPIVGATNIGVIEAPSRSELVVQGTATGVCPVKVEWLNVSHGGASRTGLFRYSREEAVGEYTSGFHLPRMLVVGIEDPVIFIVGDTLVHDGRVGLTLSGWDDMFLGTNASQSLKQRTTAELSPLVLSQVDEIVTGISAKLQERLSSFGSGYSGQDPASPSTMSDVNKLVAWLCSQSDTVSATVSSDGMLSIASVFPRDVRLYIEIERNGDVGAAVTRERRYAIDIPAVTVADLTPEVILAAVAGI